MAKTYSIIKKHFWATGQSDIEIISQFNSVDYAFKVMKTNAYREFDSIFNNTSKASMQLCSDSNYPDAWGYANNWIQICRNDKLIFEIGIIETKDLEKYK